MDGERERQLSERERRLLEELTRLTDDGVRGPEDVLAADPRLLLSLATARGSAWVRATAVVRLLHAATAALGHPRGSALRALYVLDPIPSRGMVTLTKTERRQAAGTFYNIAGDSFRKNRENLLITALAIEIDRRLSRGDNTTHAVNETGQRDPWPPQRPGPLTPPPPASSFRPAVRPSAQP